MTKTDKEYSVVMEELQGQLDRNGATIENGVVANIRLKISEEMPNVEIKSSAQKLGRGFFDVCCQWLINL